MNTGAFGEGFPYSNFHDLNMDWIIKIAKDFLDQYTHIQDVIAQGLTDLDDKTQQGLSDLQDKYDALETALNNWYNTHSEDIANQLAAALEDLNAWYTQHQNYLDETLQTNILAFNTAAEQKAAQTIETIPADYTTLANNYLEMKSAIAIMDDVNPFNTANFILGKNVNAAGEITENLYTAMYPRVPASPGDLAYRLTPERDSNNIWLLFYVSEFHGDQFLRRTTVEIGNNNPVTLGANTDNIILSYGRTASTGVTITQADVNTYFAAKLYRKTTIKGEDFIHRGLISDLGYTALSQCTEQGYYFITGSDTLSDLPDQWQGGGTLLVFRREIGFPSTTWQMLISTIGVWIRYGTTSQWYTEFNARRTISSLGYTSLSQCTEQGYYIFTGSDSLSDLPEFWTGGGILLVYKDRETTPKIYQQLISTTGSYIRYGTTGPWYSKHNNNLIKAVYDSSAGDDGSTEQLNVFIPIDDNGKTMKYNLGHCVDPSIKADVWRIMYAYLVSNIGNTRKMTIAGEWECALKLDGRANFSGGYIHGNEVEASVIAIADGIKKSISDINGRYKELRIVRTSSIYDNADPTVLIAKHGVEYVFTAEGLTINQTVHWETPALLSTCYLAMLPIAKAYSTYRYDNTDFEVKTNNQTNYSVSIPNATAITEFSDTYEDLFEMSIPVYPSGLIGGDKGLISDNNGRGYNKVYFTVCDGETVSPGTLWKSTTVIKNK